MIQTMSPNMMVCHGKERRSHQYCDQQQSVDQSSDETDCSSTTTMPLYWVNYFRNHHQSQRRKRRRNEPLDEDDQLMKKKCVILSSCQKRKAPQRRDTSSTNCNLNINNFLFSLFLLLIIPQLQISSKNLIASTATSESLSTMPKITFFASATSTGGANSKIAAIKPKQNSIQNLANNNDNNSTTTASQTSTTTTTINAPSAELMLNIVKSSFANGAGSSNGTRLSSPFKSRPGQQREHVHYMTNYACEGSQLELSCQDGKLIHLVRANYGRFSLGICNELGLSNLSVQCYSFRAFLPMEARCNKRTNCSVIVSKELFGDPCEGTSKYLEVQYYCDDGNSNNNQQQQQVSANIRTVSPQADNLGGQKESVAGGGAPTGHKSPTQAQVGGGGGAPPAAATEQRDEQPQQGTMSVIQRQFCMPQTGARNSYWNYTIAGLVARQNCPDGSSGKASWLCDGERLRFAPSWSADFTQCRTNWLQRLAHQLDQMLEQQAAGGASKQPAADWQRQQSEQTLRAILNDLALLASTKELFSEDLKRIDIMVSQIIAQLRSLAVLTGADGGWRAAASLAPMHEELFSRLVGIVSSLFDFAQRAAWLDVQPQEARRKLERRYLNHLRHAGVLLANSMGPAALEQLAPLRQANVFAGITVINGGRLSSPTAPIDPDSNEFNLQLKHTQSILSRFVTDPDEQINEFRIHLSVLRELVANGITRFLVLDIKKPDYSLIRHQLESSSSSSYATYASGADSAAMDANGNLLSDQQWSSRVFGVFAISGENGDVSDGNANSQQENKLADLLAQWPISVDFRVSPTSAAAATTSADQLQAARQCNSLSDNVNQANRCQTARSNATNHICRCDQFGFVALSALPAAAAQDSQQQVPTTNHLAADFPWPPPPVVAGGQQDFDVPSLGGAFPAGYQGRERPLVAPPAFGSGQTEHDAAKSSPQKQQQALSIWTIIFMVLGLSVLIVSLATFVINTIVRATRLNKKPGFLSTGTSILGHARDVGPTTGPLTDHSLMSGEPLASSAATTTNASSTQSSASMIGLSTGTATTCHAYKTHQQLYAAHYPNIDGSCVTAIHPASRWTTWARWLRPSRWLSAASAAGGPSSLGKDHHLGGVHHRIVGSTLANAHSAAYKSHFQNGYTTSLHHHNQSPVVVQSASAAASNLPLAAPSSASSYVSSSAYYEEIGPGNLTKVNTSQLSNTHTIVDPFKRQGAAATDQQHLLASSGAHLQQQQRPQQQQAWSHPVLEAQQQIVTNNNNYGHQLALHNDLSQLQQQAVAAAQPSSSAGSQHSAATNVTTANSSTPRHYLFASPSAVSAYKSSMISNQQHTLQHHQHQQQQHLHQLQQQQFQQQQRFMQS